MDRAGAEPAAAIAAEHPGGAAGPERPGPGSPRRHARHNRTPPCGGQRVMRHFPPAGRNLRRRAPAAFAVAPLALGMLVTAPPAVLVAPPRKAHRSTPSPAAAAPRAVDVAVIAAPAENHLAAARGAVEQAGGVPHRDRRERGGPPPEPARYCAYEPCPAWPGGCGAGRCQQANGAGAASFSLARVYSRQSRCQGRETVPGVPRARCGQVARRRQTRGGRCGGLLDHSSVEESPNRQSRGYVGIRTGHPNRRIRAVLDRHQHLSPIASGTLVRGRS